MNVRHFLCNFFAIFPEHGDRIFSFLRLPFYHYPINYYNTLKQTAKLLNSNLRFCGYVNRDSPFEPSTINLN